MTKQSLFITTAYMVAASLGLLLLAACTFMPFERVDYKVYPTAENPADFFGRVYTRTRTEEAKTRRVPTIDEASLQVGFPVRLPTYLPGNLEGISDIIITQSHAYRVEVDLNAAVALLQSAGIPTAALPPGSEGIQVDATLAATALTHQGSDPQFVTFIQSINPSYVIPPGLDPALLEEIGRLGWQYLGLTPEQAHQLSQGMNWASYLVLPPADMDSAESVTINGAQGVFLQTSNPDIQHQAILWEDDGILYGLYSNLPREEIRKIAESLPPGNTTQ